MYSNFIFMFCCLDVIINLFIKFGKLLCFIYVRYVWGFIFLSVVGWIKKFVLGLI